MDDCLRSAEEFAYNRKMQDNPKKTKLEGKTIGTHSGTFHCDEALACWLLHQTEQFKDARIVRSRDPEVLNKLDILVDVGGEYDPSRFRFDHHQRGFTGVFDDKHETKLSSAGLIYKHFGREVITRLANTDGPTTELFYQKLYNNFIEAIDGIDNGVSQYPREVKPRYRISTDLSSRVGYLNPSWNEPEHDIDERFGQAVALTGAEFKRELMYLNNSWLPARAIVEKALLARETEFGPNSEIMLLPQYCPWKSHLDDLEEEYGIPGHIKFVLFADSSGTWRVQAVGVSSESFESRVPLPEPWRGLRDNQLSAVTGVEGCIFIHATGFIGGAKTYEGVRALAEMTLRMAKEQQQLQ